MKFGFYKIVWLILIGTISAFAQRQNSMTSSHITAHKISIPVKENKSSIPKIDLMINTPNASHRNQNNANDVSHFTISADLHQSLVSHPVSHFEQRLTIHNAAVVI
ncbi:MAG: hypothetical protein WBO36_06835, partial [Saprospiraceae bacterium]